MIQKTQLYNLLALLISICYNCNHTEATKYLEQAKKKEIISKDSVYKKIAYFVELYNFEDEHKKLSSYADNNSNSFLTGNLDSIIINKERLYDEPPKTGYH